MAVQGKIRGEDPGWSGILWSGIGWRAQGRCLMICSGVVPDGVLRGGCLADRGCPYSTAEIAPAEVVPMASDC